MGDVLGGGRGPAHVVGEAVDTLAVAAVDLDERLFLALRRSPRGGSRPGTRATTSAGVVVSSGPRVESVTAVVTPWSRQGYTPVEGSVRTESSGLGSAARSDHKVFGIDGAPLPGDIESEEKAKVKTMSAVSLSIRRRTAPPPPAERRARARRAAARAPSAGRGAAAAGRGPPPASARRSASSRSTGCSRAACRAARCPRSTGPPRRAARASRSPWSRAPPGRARSSRGWIRRTASTRRAPPRRGWTSRGCLWLRGGGTGGLPRACPHWAQSALGSGLFEAVVLDLAGVPADELRRLPGDELDPPRRARSRTRPTALLLVAGAHVACGPGGSRWRLGPRARIGRASRARAGCSAGSRRRRAGPSRAARRRFRLHAV